MSETETWTPEEQKPDEMWKWIMREVGKLRTYKLMTIYAHKPGEEHAMFHLMKKEDGEYVFWTESLRISSRYFMPSMIEECCQYCNQNGLELYISVTEPRTHCLNVSEFYLAMYKENHDG